MVAAALGGLALAGAFPPTGLWPLAPLGPALLTAALWQRRLRNSFALGLIFGLACFVPLLSWLVNVAWYVWLALAVAEALVFALLCIGQRLLLRLPAWPVAVAGWWVLAEALRARWPYAFPWGRLAMSQAGAPTAAWAALAGVTGLSFLLALAGATLAWLLLTSRPSAMLRPQPISHPARPSASPTPNPSTQPTETPSTHPTPNPSTQPSPAQRLIIPALAFVAAFGLLACGALLPVSPRPAGVPTVVVAAVQGNVPHARSVAGLLRASTVTANHANATEQLARGVRAGTRPAPDLVIWPENSTDIDPRLYPPVYAAITRAVAAINRPVLVGEVLQHPQRNAGQLWTPAHGPGPTYIKRQLVPFGEYIPFRALLSHVTSLVALQPHDFTPGRHAVVFGVGRIRLGDVICYEVAFDGLVSSEVTVGANLLAVQSNDATFEVDGNSTESRQQIAMARLRAVESNRAVVYASTTGESAIIAPDGSLLAHSGTWRRAVLEARVPLISSLTPADRAGGWPQAVIVVLTLAAMAWAAGRAMALRRAGSRHS